ncbi:MAG: hypothetical protein WCP69_12440 [Bacteroidota bacterium]
MKKIALLNLVILGILISCSKLNYYSYYKSSEKSAMRYSCYIIDYDSKSFFWKGRKNCISVARSGGDVVKINDTLFLFKSKVDIHNIPIKYIPKNHTVSLSSVSIECVSKEPFYLEDFKLLEKMIIFNSGDTVKLFENRYNLKKNKNFKIKVGYPVSYTASNFNYLITQEINADSLINNDVLFEIEPDIFDFYYYINDTIICKKGTLIDSKGRIFRKPKNKKDMIGLYKGEVEIPYQQHKRYW